MRFNNEVPSHACTIPPVDPEIFHLDIKRNINEFQTQDIRITLDDYKIFEIKCIELGAHQLPFGEEARKDTEFDRINPSSPGIAQ